MDGMGMKMSVMDPAEFVIIANKHFMKNVRKNIKHTGTIMKYNLHKKIELILDKLFYKNKKIKIMFYYFNNEMHFIIKNGRKTKYFSHENENELLNQISKYFPIS